MIDVGVGAGVNGGNIIAKGKPSEIIKNSKKFSLLLDKYETKKIGAKNFTKEEPSEEEIQKQIKGMPGQEKMVLEYYQKNPSATQHLQSTLYEEKVINFIKTKIKLEKKVDFHKLYKERFN